MEVMTVSARFQRAQELLSFDKPGEALGELELVLGEEPENEEVLETAGYAAALSGDALAAIDYFEKVLEGPHPTKGALYGLLEILQQLEEGDLAREAFIRHGRKFESDELKEQYRSRLGVDCELVEAERAPTLGSAEATRSLRIGFVCGPHTKRIAPIEGALAADHEVKHLHLEGPGSHHRIQALMDWADVTWFERCDGLLAEASRRLEKKGPVVCRLYDYEASGVLLKLTNWAFVDHIVFVSAHEERAYRSEFGVHPPASVIPFGIDTDAMRTRTEPRTKRIAYLGYLNAQKNPELLLQCMADLVGRDPDYQLHIGGSFKDLRYERYFERMIPAMALEGNVFIDGGVDDVDGWLDDKSFVVSTSLSESFALEVAEGMARGLKPIVHNWPGADEIFPVEFLFNTVAEFSERVLEEAYDPAAYRRYIIENYALQDQLRAIERMLQSLTKQKRTHRVQATTVA